MALKRFKASPLPNPPLDWDPLYMRQLIRTLETFHSQLDSQTPNFAEEYEAVRFIGGVIYQRPTTVTASGALPVTASIVLADASAGAVTIALPTAASSAGRILTVKKVDASGNAVTLDADASETIDGATTLALAAQYDTARIVCDGTQWWVI